MLFLQKLCFSGKKSPRQGCTTQKTELGMHQNQSRVGGSNLFQIDFELTLDLHGSIFRKSSENLDDMTLGCAWVPKIIPMQVQGGLRGPYNEVEALPRLRNSDG